MAKTQRTDVEAWLDHDHDLTDTQIDDLTSTFRAIADRWPGEDDADEREAACTVAYRLLVEPPAVVLAEIREERTRAALALVRTKAAGTQAAVTLLATGAGTGETQQSVADQLGVHLSAVRDWIGRRQR